VNWCYFMILAGFGRVPGYGSASSMVPSGRPGFDPRYMNYPDAHPEAYGK
jgi:hypothetical protein